LCLQKRPLVLSCCESESYCYCGWQGALLTSLAVVVVGLGVVVGCLVYRNRCTTLAKYLPRVPLPAPLWQSLFLGERRCLIVRTLCACMLCVKGICGSLSIFPWLRLRDHVCGWYAGVCIQGLVEGPLGPSSTP
jgi:hypothetical protein